MFSLDLVLNQGITHLTTKLTLEYNSLYDLSDIIKTVTFAKQIILAFTFKLSNPLINIIKNNGPNTVP